MNQRRLPRYLLLALLLCLTLAGIVILFGTERGQQLRDWHQLHHLGRQFRGWVAGHPFVAPIVFVSLYVLLAVCSLPVWWLQILAGFGWGVVGGTFWCVGAGTAAASITVACGHWLGGDWIHAKAGRKLRRIQHISERAGHNGLVVVLICRLCHGVPFGLSNYLFGLIGVSTGEAALGTAIGLIPVSAFYTALGGKPHLRHDPRFWAAVVGLNVLLLSPLIVRWIVRRTRGQDVSADGREQVAIDASNP